MLEYKQQATRRFATSPGRCCSTIPRSPAQLRYFEVAPGGHTTLERHEHAHAVVVHRGAGRCLVGDRVYELHEHDLVHVPALTWHQFRADDDAPLGFLCMVNAVRDRPQLPSADDIEKMCETPVVAAFLAPRDGDGR